MFVESEIEVAYDYGICIRPDVFETHSNYAVIPNRLTLGYAIAFCLQGKAKNISLVGFEGFSAKDPRQKEMQNLIFTVNSKYRNLRSLTPTSYSIPQISIYGF